ncbi:hypothetical protein [Neomegalonema sp.]|uniref:hypothetical protein n=1 Tax=Neomegalonema sp. TaxID=2039713 RepID=UPI00260C3647|nr:hypothetical protein [Neomegalonema sp.]MDD2868615.1 hypothetical protein [Neomegalonema sp.]
MKSFVFAALGVALLAVPACSRQAAHAPTPRPVPTPPTELAETPQDLCRAAALQSLVGGPLSALPAVPDGVSRRVVGEGDPMTMDLRLDRQTVVYDKATSNIRSITCV